MTRPRLRRPDQPLGLRCLLGVYEFAASLQLAVVLITALALVLALATVLESHYGDKSRAVNQGLYETWWFATLNALLGLNVLCAALIRWPWKRQQTGFLLTHAGILLLLLGSYVTQGYGIDAQLPVYEGEAEWRAFERTQHLRLSVFDDRDPGAARGVLCEGNRAQVVQLPFTPGPFNWDDYAQRCWFPWRLAHWTRGVLYDCDGIRLEILDYLADSVELQVPQVTIRATGLQMPAESDESSSERLVLTIQPPGSRAALRPYGSSLTKQLPGGQSVCFWMTGDADETAAFSRLAPEGPLGTLGQVVFYQAGKTYRFSLDQIKPGKRQALGASGLDWELERLDSGMLAALVQLYRGADKVGRMALLANRPQFNAPDYRNHVFGEYWLAPPEDLAAAKARGLTLDEERRAGLAAPRIDLLQGADLKLYCRTWRAPQAGPATTLASDSGPLVLWDKTPAELALQVDDFRPSATPGKEVVPLEFQRSKAASDKQSRVRVALTVDGKHQEFWLAGMLLDPLQDPLPAAQRPIVEGKGRRVALTLSADVIDVGFRVYLQKFIRKVDPGTGMAAYFASLVDFCDRHDPQEKLRSDVLITLNEPVSFADPRSGRSFRLYQESFSGPFAPGDDQFEHFVGGKDQREQVYASHFAVNYDPGRPWKYAGCLLIVGGILVIFYMRAYFFASRSASGGIS